MMKISRWLLLGLLMIFSNLLRAEGECPPGMFPTNPPGAGGPVGCAPIPGYNEQQQAPQAPPQRWESRWGAIATDSVKGILGAVTSQSSKNDAQQAAMADCQAKGGTQCRVDVAYDNECGVVVVGDGGYNVSINATIDKASQRGVSVCTKAGRTNCHVYYSACSLPVRIQ